MLGIMILVGAVYVYITDRSGFIGPKIETGKSILSSPIPQPVAPSPNNPEGVSLVILTSPVNSGSNASMTISTNAGSTCSIVVSYNGVVSKDSGLTTKSSGVYGSVSWTWSVGSSVPSGSWPIVVTCLFHGRSAVLDSNIVVQK